MSIETSRDETSRDVGSARVTEAGPASGRSPGGDALTEIVLATFALNGRLLAAAEILAKPAGLTAARWQVLGAVLREPRTVSGIARVMGLTRQSVQRLADVIVDQGLAEYLPNPAHRRAMLLTATPAGLQAVRSIHDDQVAWADTVTSGVDAAELRQMLATMERLITALDRHPPAAASAADDAAEPPFDDQQVARGDVAVEPHSRRGVRRAERELPDPGGTHRIDEIGENLDAVASLGVVPVDRAASVPGMQARPRPPVGSVACSASRNSARSAARSAGSISAPSSTVRPSSQL